MLAKPSTSKSVWTWPHCWPQKHCSCEELLLVSAYKGHYWYRTGNLLWFQQCHPACSLAGALSRGLAWEGAWQSPALQGRENPRGQGIPGVRVYWHICSLTLDFPVLEEKGNNLPIGKLPSFVLNGTVAYGYLWCPLPQDTVHFAGEARRFWFPKTSRPAALLPAGLIHTRGYGKAVAGSVPASCRRPLHSTPKALNSPALQVAGRALGQPGTSLGWSATGNLGLLSPHGPYCSILWVAHTAIPGASGDQRIKQVPAFP